MGDTTKSVQSLEQVTERGDATVKAVAQFALGSIYKKHGENQKAIEVYKRLYDSGGYSKAAVAFELGSVYEANKQLTRLRISTRKLFPSFLILRSGQTLTRA